MTKKQFREMLDAKFRFWWMQDSLEGDEVKRVLFQLTPKLPQELQDMSNLAAIYEQLWGDDE